jgi:Ulp1 family protease
MKRDQQKNPNIEDRTFIMPTHFSELIFWPKTKNGPADFNPGEVYNWAKKYKILNHKQIIFPINIKKSHWFHIIAKTDDPPIVKTLADPDDSAPPTFQLCLVYQDSWRVDDNMTKWLGVVQDFLAYTYEQEYKHDLDTDTTLSTDPGEDFPRQENGDDCGVFYPLL